MSFYNKYKKGNKKSSSFELLLGFLRHDPCLPCGVGTYLGSHCNCLLCSNSLFGKRSNCIHKSKNRSVRRINLFAGYCVGLPYILTCCQIQSSPYRVLLVEMPGIEPGSKQAANISTSDRL